MKTEFKDVEFMTGKEKLLVLKQWTSFIKTLNDVWSAHQVTTQDLDRLFLKFTDRVYEHLNLNCSFIAHFDRRGFFGTYFTEPENLINFLHQFDKDLDFKSVEYGGSGWIEGDYSDLNKAMCEVVEEYKSVLYKILAEKLKADDIATAKSLLAKHNINLEVLK